MIKICPEHLFQHLEFDKILHLVHDACLIKQTRDVYFPIKIEIEKNKIDQLLDEVLEFRIAFESSALLPLQAVDSISDSLTSLHIIDFSLDLESLVNIFKVLTMAESMSSYFGKEGRKEDYPISFEYFKTIQYHPELYKKFKEIFNDSGEILADASPELRRISKAIRSKETEIDQVFRSLIMEYRRQGWLADQAESIRNGRRVAAVQSEHKRKIKGIIHDESATGRTAYIEPESIIEKNNDLFDLEMEYQTEIFRILQALTKECSGHQVMLSDLWDLILRFDFIRAKAMVAVNYQGWRPEVFDKPLLKIKSARHPLLFIKNKNTGKKTVPSDIILLGENRILLISGPNAGGKSIAMKSAGLIQLMMQSGMLIPVHESSEMGIFHSFFGDIGDQQSLEDDLSTYSSRLLKMKEFLEYTDDRSLIFIDEFGSGTDPKIGGAIAEAILIALNKKKVHGVITTHYSNLKVMAFNTKGLLNGAMIFDKDLLLPTFELKVGRPGSSYAFEVAARSGLSAEVIAHARNRTDQDQKELEDLLINLQKDKQDLQDQLTRTKEKEQGLDKLIKNYTTLADELELRKKRIKIDQKQWDLQKQKEIANGLDKTLRQWQTEKSKPKIEERILVVHNTKEVLEKEIISLKQEIQVLDKHQAKPLSIGSYVKLRQGDDIGIIKSIRKNNAEVEMGVLTLNVALADLVPARQPVQEKQFNNRSFQLEEKVIDPSLDIRGLSKSQAMEILQNYLDRALLANLHEVRILHGKGNGTLKELVKQQSKEYKAMSGLFHPPAEAGGEGITIIKLQ